MADIDSDVHLDSEVLFDFYRAIVRAVDPYGIVPEHAHMAADSAINEVLNAGLLIRRRSPVEEGF